MLDDLLLNDLDFGLAAFALAVLIILLWIVTGPIFNFSDTWQLVINTGTTIITFLMVFLIQNTQNRDSSALQLKLDELIRATEARNRLIGIERLPEPELESVREKIDKKETVQQPYDSDQRTKNSKKNADTWAEYAELRGFA